VNLEQITPVILTFNEAPNIERVLHKLDWAKSIIVVDSYSSDETVELVSKFPKATVFQREFDDHATQWNFAVSKAAGQWVLSLDADYLVQHDLLQEIRELPDRSEFSGYYIPFKYCVFGKPLSASILPVRCALFNKDKASYVNDGHTQVLKPQGATGVLEAHIHHDDRKSFSRWLQNQEKYVLLEVKKLTETPMSDLSFVDRIRKWKIVAPFLVFFYCLFLKGGILDGWRGLYYAVQRFIVEALLSFRLIGHSLGFGRK